MIRKMLETLEFDKVLLMLEEQALSENVKARIRGLKPYLSEPEVAGHMDETTDAKRIIEVMGDPPLSIMNELEKSLAVLGKGTFLLPEQLSGVAQFLTACRRLKSYLKKAESVSAKVACYGGSIYALPDVEEEINRAVRGEQLDDRASPLLYDIRRKIANVEGDIKSKLESLLKNNKAWFSEGFVSERNGRFTLPVRREYKNNVSGAVVDISQSGSTYFIEPAAVRKLTEEAALLRIEEDNEIRRVLYALTALVEENLQPIKVDIQAMESLDFIFAKARLSRAMKAVPVPVTLERSIEIKGGRHPLLKSESVVPLDFSIGREFRGVVITGPNTGGKTVALKTIGLFSLMAQSGLHVPAESGHFTMNNYVLCDIGDGQSITENLSTFSSHMTNIIEILGAADDQSLVLLDELGSGTDPAEGMGLAVAILEELKGRGCLFVATTHYPEIKEFAASEPGLVNARMAFDRRSLLPLYRLEIGEAGESCALYIARRLGLPRRLVERAGRAAYGAGPGGRAAAMQGLGGLTAGTQGGDAGAAAAGGGAARAAAEHRGADAYIRELTAPVEGLPAEKAGQRGPHVRIKKQEAKRDPENPRSMQFNIGDSVIVYPQKMIGIVYRKANDKGEVGVQVKKNKLVINHKRLKLHIPAGELYPEDYDFSIIFDRVADRKARHVMGKRHEPGLAVETNPEKEVIRYEGYRD